MIKGHNRRSEDSMREGKGCFDIQNDVFTKLMEETERKQVLYI
jgi:hypothetical protein